MKRPHYIQEYIDFGWGDFSDEERGEKCESIYEKISSKRGDIPPTASVVIPAHKEERYLLGTLRSLAEQTHKNFEIILVSNGELKGNITQQIAEKSGARVVHYDIGRVSLARQLGLEAAEGKYIISTDADTLHHPDWINTVIREMELTQTTYGFGEINSLSKKIIPQLFVQACNLVGRLRRHIKALRFSGVSEANSYFLRKRALEVGGYDIRLDYSEGFSLIRKMCPDLNPTLISNKEARVYTSSRKIDQINLIDLCRASIGVGLNRIQGKEKYLDKDNYPDIR